MEELCNRFPKICNCPYHNDIDHDLENGRTPYYIANWLQKTECRISDTTIRRYQKYCFDNGILELKTTIQAPSKREENLLTKLEKKALAALESLDVENVSDNVKVQLILGACKLIYGNKYLIDANVDSKVTMSNLFDDDLIDEILDGDNDE